MIVAAGFGTGLINTLASSGSVITLPLLTFLGLPPDIVGVIVVSFLLLLRPPHWVTAPGPGAWAGFIVLDTVTYMLFAGVLGVGFDLVRTYAVKALLLLAVSLSSVVVSFEGRPVNSRIGVLPGGGTMAGGWVGARMGSKPWAKGWIRRALVVMTRAELLHPAYGFIVLLPP